MAVEVVVFVVVGVVVVGVKVVVEIYVVVEVDVVEYYSRDKVVVGSSVCNGSADVLVG